MRRTLIIAVSAAALALLAVPAAADATTLTKTASTVTVAASAPPAPGEPLTVTATVTPSDATGSDATGSVDFTASLKKVALALPGQCATALITSGTATCTFTPPTTGALVVTAAYLGSPVYARSRGTLKVAVLADSTLTITDSATTTAANPSPVMFGATIVFTARVGTTDSALKSPLGTVTWTLHGDGPDYAATGSGTDGACTGPVPVVRGVATCSVTPGYYPDGGNGDAPTPYIWGIAASAVFTPTAVNTFRGTNASDDTVKITVSDQMLPVCTNGVATCGPVIPVAVEPGTFMTFSVAATDALGRSLAWTWCGFSADGTWSCPTVVDTDTFDD